MLSREIWAIVIVRENVCNGYCPLVRTMKRIRVKGVIIPTVANTNGTSKKCVGQYMLKVLMNAVMGPRRRRCSYMELLCFMVRWAEQVSGHLTHASAVVAVKDFG